LIKIAPFAEDTKLIASDKSKEGNRDHDVYSRLYCLTLP